MLAELFSLTNFCIKNKAGHMERVHLKFHWGPRPCNITQ